MQLNTSTPLNLAMHLPSLSTLLQVRKKTLSRKQTSPFWVILGNISPRRPQLQALSQVQNFLGQLAVESTLETMVLYGIRTVCDWALAFKDLLLLLPHRIKYIMHRLLTMCISQGSINIVFSEHTPIFRPTSGADMLQI